MRGLTRKMSAKVAAVAMLMSGGLLAMQAPALASCNLTGTISGIYYYSTTTCGTQVLHITGATGYGTIPSGAYDNIGSVLIQRDTGGVGGQYVTQLFDAIDYYGNEIGLTNVSTTANKAYNLSSYGDGGGTWYHVAKSLNQYTQ